MPPAGLSTRSWAGRNSNWIPFNASSERRSKPGRSHGKASLPLTSTSSPGAGSTCERT